MCTYQVMATDGFTLEGVAANLTVAWVSVLLVSPTPLHRRGDCPSNCDPA
jgi:hypothetical protein